MPKRGGKPGSPLSMSPPERSSRPADRASTRVVGKDKERSSRGAAAKDPSSKEPDAAGSAAGSAGTAAKKRAPQAPVLGAPGAPGAPRRETLESPSAATLREREREAAAEKTHASPLDAAGHPVVQPRIEPPPPSNPGAVRAWFDANRAPAPGQGREPFRIPVELVGLHTDPAILPEEPLASGGLFELVGTVARRALTLGLASREPSFHVFVAASPQVMIEDDIVRYAEQFSRTRPTPPDIVYVHDFDRPEAPKPLLVPAGAGATFAEAMAGLIDRLREEIPGLSQHDEVRRATQKLVHELEAQNREVLGNLETTAKGLGFGVRSIQGGVQTFPILHGKPLSAEQFTALDESTKKALGEAEERLTAEVDKAAGLVRDQNASFDAAREEAMSRLSEAVIQTAMGELRKILEDFGTDVHHYLETVEAALVEDWADFLELGPQQPHEDGESKGEEHDPEHATRLGRFKVNLLVAHEEGSPPPVIYETNPTYPNLFGYLERRARFGALLTDFTRIRPGSLHAASGGVLVVRAADLMTDPIIWERVKRILRERRIGAEDPLGPLGLYATTLRPVPVPIRVRVVMVGPPDLYAMLLEADADFAALFRVKVEIEPTIPRTDDHLRALDAYLMQMAKEREWGAFDRGARAMLLDLATRLAGDRQKVSLALAPLEETAAFASALAAARAGGPTDWADSGPLSRAPVPFHASTSPANSVVTAEDVAIAWRERRERAGAAERHIRELTLRGEVSLDTEGERVGVVNGLSVYSAGDVEFGQPMRITTVVALGREGIVDVEHEAQLGGAIHTKGVAIIRGYLSRIFGQERPLSIKAQIAFEQSYGEIDGDSASSTELYGVLSALSDVPIDQGIAVTGSVNQLGDVQAIGGVCAKIEGFFELCLARGLTGKQGVMLPRTNLDHLVLREDVAHAIAEGKFHLYAVATVSQGIEILTGVPAGVRDASGRFPAASVFGRVERRVIEIAERLREAEGHHGGVPALESRDDVSHADLSDAGDYLPR
ncbi:MAG: ATP-dependent protease La [Labilithrix sp.]|nr:ATP-dependent protease La [Labilithrix sp.]